MSLIFTDAEISLIKDVFFREFLSCSQESCWEWLSDRTKAGYGRITIKGKRVYAHRVAYALTHGETPNDKLVCHKCDNRCCVNPSHLFLGTNNDNTQDMIQKGRNARGELSRSAVLSDEDVKNIRKMYQDKTHNQRQIASLYSVWQSTISDVLKRVTWEHVS